MKKRYKLLILFPLLFLMACSSGSNLNEGECKGIIAFSDTTRIFSMLDQKTQDALDIRIELQNITTEKTYDICLNKDNKFTQEVSLNPGTYHVVYAYSHNKFETGIETGALQEDMVFEQGKTSRLDVVITNEEDLTKQWIDLTPLPEIILANKYSRLVQIDRGIVSLDQIVSALDLSDFQGDRLIKGYGKQEIRGGNGIFITLQNTTAEPLDITQCKVLSVKFTQNRVVFPGGVRLGDSVEAVSHKKNGVYGEPTSFGGLALWGWDFDNSSIIYQDDVSKDRITLTLNAECNEIIDILYELEKYE